MRITVIGAGPVGRTLAEAWDDAGHDVDVVVRRPDDPGYAGLGRRFRVRRPDAALRDAEQPDATLLAIPATAVPDLVHHYAEALDGRVLIDATNRMGRVTFHQLPLFTSYTPRARLFRAFCSYGWDVFASPVIDGVPVDLPFCGPGDVPGDVGLVEKLISDVGMNPRWIGGTDQADTLDGVLRLWYSLAVDRNLGRRLGLRVLTGPPV